MLVGDAREALKDQEAPLDRLRSLTGELQQLAQALSSSTPLQGSSGTPSADGGDDEDVIDAEFSTS
jgi:molecular chaperone DnaK